MKSFFAAVVLFLIIAFFAKKDVDRQMSVQRSAATCAGVRL
ncbi:hypothetical protein [Paraburkholderia sp. GAS82]